MAEILTVGWLNAPRDPALLDRLTGGMPEGAVTVDTSRPDRTLVIYTEVEGMSLDDVMTAFRLAYERETGAPIETEEE